MKQCWEPLKRTGYFLIIFHRTRILPNIQFALIFLLKLNTIETTCIVKTPRGLMPNFLPHSSEPQQISIGADMNQISLDFKQ